MNKLLSANFMRLFRSRHFWIELASMLLFGVFTSIYFYSTAQNPDLLPPLDNVVFLYALMIGGVCAIFCSLFLGAEYSDGTIRNKLVVGHTRSTIYLSNLIVCSAAGLLMCAAYLLTALAIGIPLLGTFQGDLATVLAMFGDTAMMVLSFTAIFTMLSMANKNKTVVAIISIVSFFLLLFLAVSISNQLAAPKMETLTLFTDSGLATQTVENPNYLEGTKRAVYQFVQDFLPTGQAFQLSHVTDSTPLWRLPLYSLVIVVVTTLSGLLLFRRKNIN